MANPRQRRKMRSGTAKNTVSKQTVKNKHKVIVKGSEALALAWDKKKTVRQNYAALGLLTTSNPRLAGGLEPLSHTPFALSSMSSATVDDLEAALAAHADAEAQSDSDDEDDEPTASTSKAVVEEKLKPGMARIVRDENGNVVSIIVGGQNGEEVEEKIVEPSRAAGGEDGEGSDDDDESDDEEEKEEPSPWGAPMKDWSVKNADEVPQFDDSEDLVMANAATAVRKPAKVKQGIEISGPVKRVAAKSEVIRVLERQAQFKTKVVRVTSSAERDWLISLVAQYDDDITKMARDRKANVWQRTPGELKRMINKAGGLEALQAAAKAAPAATEEEA